MQSQEEAYFPLPESSDKLFNDFNSKYQFNAIIITGVSKFFLFSDAYKTASIKLFEQHDGSAFYANTLVYPLVFLNRHFIELRLKELISGLNYSSDGIYNFTSTHNLQKLWVEYKKLLSTMGKNLYPETHILENTEKLILEFDTVDPISMCFRYPVDKSNEKNPSLQMTNLDLENFRQTMFKLYNFFDTQSDVIFELIDMANDFFTEIRQQ